MQFGKPGQNKGSNDTENFGRPAKIFIDAKANEAYIADGYGNKRVAVIDADTGKFKRYWGAYGNKPDDTNFGNYDPKAPPIKQFRTPVHCAELSNDGLVYVCDRPNDRIQIFKPDGTFVKEVFVATNTLGDGSVWDIAFSKDPQQKYLFLADGKNEKIYVMLRETMEILTSFGDGGRQPGQFFAVHSIAIDSKGNIYTVETYEGRRLQKFVYKGLAPVTKKDQGTVWPKSRSRIANALDRDRVRVAGGDRCGAGRSQPTNDLPNPYQTIANHFKMPEGRTWGSTSAVERRQGRQVDLGRRALRRQHVPRLDARSGPEVRRVRQAGQELRRGADDLPARHPRGQGRQHLDDGRAGQPAAPRARRAAGLAAAAGAGDDHRPPGVQVQPATASC